ncbi:MAG: TipAS antibiotic-recognition domain-containing protein [Clostridia bacterium]|nr:TipAS antibiotic-recognition domain-containing protein [Clostridia bacterium]
MVSCNKEVKERWGGTAAHSEYEKKTADYSIDKWQRAADGLNGIFAELSRLKAEGIGADSEKAQTLVRRLQSHITEYYYTCTNEILAGLGRMYTEDERFKANIDKHGDGTAVYASEAIAEYVK